MSKSRIVALVALAAALAAAGAGWKWARPAPRHTLGHERLAGWTWDARARA